MQLRILESAADSVRAGYECPCGCRPSVTYEQHAQPVQEGCCCGNEFAVGPYRITELIDKPGYRAETTSFDAPWGEKIRAAWLIGPSVHADDSHDHERDDGAAAAGHVHTAHDDATRFEAVDPVCGMTVDIQGAKDKDLRSTYGGHEYFFCGRGCKLDFDEDRERYLDPAYVPTM